MLSKDVKFVEEKCWSDPSYIQKQESSYLLYLPIRFPGLEVHWQEETPKDKPPQSQKTRSLRELYDQTLVIDEQVQYALFTSHPTTFEEVASDAQWVKAMNDEIGGIEWNQTWDIVDLPVNNTSIGVKWIYNTKEN